MQARKHASEGPSWLCNQGQTSPEVKNRGISGPTKRTDVLQFFFKILHNIGTSLNFKNLDIFRAGGKLNMYKNLLLSNGIQ